MNEPAASVSSGRLEAAVAEFFESLERGQSPDRGALLSRYPDVAGELAEFLADHDRLDALARPLRAPTPALDVTIASQPAASDRSAEGTTWQIGDYDVLSELGRGGMGVVYRARHRSLNRTVALKTILAGQLASSDDRSRFQAEAVAAARLSHPGIVAIYEVGEAAGQPYISMPLIEGQSLAKRLEAGPVSPHEAARLLRKLVAAVAYAHSQGVIHRDLKPANILLAPASKSDAGQQLAGLDAYEPRITDFGLAKRLDDEGHLTASGQILGTPSYMPPEQASGRVHAIGQAADIYSLGAILYALLTGRPPFQSENPVEVLLQVLESEPPLPSRVQAGVPRELEWICLKCLEKNPADRYATAVDLGLDLDRFLRHEPPSAGQATVVHRLRRWIRRQPVLAGHAIGLAVPLSIAQVVFVLHPGRDFVYHAKITGTLVAWLVFSFAFRWLIDRRPRGWWPLYGWCAADSLFLTAVLAVMVSPLGVFVSGYLLLIITSALASRTRLVAFATGSSIAGYLALLLLRPEESRPLHYAALAIATFVLAGLALGYQVWRIGVLREYYGERNVG